MNRPCVAGVCGAVGVAGRRRPRTSANGIRRQKVRVGAKQQATSIESGKAVQSVRVVAQKMNGHLQAEINTMVHHRLNEDNTIVRGTTRRTMVLAGR